MQAQQFALPIPPGEYAAYLFDLDGTVADSMPLHYVAWSQAITKHGGTFPQHLFYEWAGIPTHRTVEMLNERFGYTMSPNDVVEFKEGLYYDMLPQLQPVASVLEHITAMAGKVPFAIVSGSPRLSIFKTLETLGMLHLFPVIVGAEDYTRGKPHPEPFLKAASLLGVDPARCLVFEDGEQGIRSATAAGMTCVRVPLPTPDAALA